MLFLLDFLILGVLVMQKNTKAEGKKYLSTNEQTYFTIFKGNQGHLKVEDLALVFLS